MLRYIFVHMKCAGNCPNGDGYPYPYWKSVENQFDAMNIQHIFVWTLLIKVFGNTHICSRSGIQASSLEMNRELHVATCETGHNVGWMKNDSLLIWNISGRILQDSVTSSNVCEGLNWKLHGHGLLNKPMAYLSYISQTIDRYRLIGDANINNLHFILMDSDTIWSVNHVNEIWEIYDCVRQGKDIIVSTEFGCWMGKHCTNNDTQLWYPNISSIPSHSVFVNSGVIMGKGIPLRDMLQYILRNNASYLTYNTKKKPPVYQFHDQHATADYALRIRPDLVALDIHQQFAGSFGIEIPGGDKNSPVVCKGRDGQATFNCKEISVDIFTKFPSIYKLNESTCSINRKPKKSMAGYYAMESISSTPLIWHGNGKAKKIFLSVGHSAVLCHLRHRHPEFNFSSISIAEAASKH